MAISLSGAKNKNKFALKMYKYVQCDVMQEFCRVTKIEDGISKETWFKFAQIMKK